MPILWWDIWYICKKHASRDSNIYEILCACVFVILMRYVTNAVNKHIYVYFWKAKKNISEKKYEKKNLNGSAYIIYVNKQTIIMKKIQSGLSVYELTSDQRYTFNDRSLFWVIVKAIYQDPSPSIFAYVPSVNTFYMCGILRAASLLHNY